MTAAFVNDANGNMTTRTVNGQAYTQEFDIDNRLTKVIKEAGTNDLSAWFYYDADGNRILTVYKNGTAETSRVYTPFPDYEETVPASGGVTKRVTFSLAGQLIAVRVITDTTNNYYYAYADHLGNISAWTNTSGALVSGSLARYDPYGIYRTEPGTNVNPGISDRGFTGHRMNNTNVNDLGLIYMNARYYLPEIGRFISPDSIVPDPQNPQSFNRYSYVNNNPVNYTDPTGNYAQCSATDSDGNYANCDEWMLEAIRILGLEGGLDGGRLAELFWQWFNDPGKMLRINAYYVLGSSMYTRQFSADTAGIFIDMNVVSGFVRGNIALLGHELEHVSQGTWQAWSIQGEVLAYQVEYGIREAMAAGQTPNTEGAMGELSSVRPPYNANSYPDLAEARSGFLGDQGEPYNVWYEPNLPWRREITYRAWQSAGQSELVQSLIVNSASWLTTPHN